MSKYNNKKMILNDFYCVKCGNKSFPIPRMVGKEREAGHLKKIFCLTCQEETNHVECRPFTKYDYDDFLLEFEHGNFDEKGKRIMSYGLFRQKMNNEGVDLP